MPKFPWAESVGFIYPGSQARSGEARPSCFVSRTLGDESDAAQTLRGSHSTGAGLPPDLTWGCCGPPAIWALTFLHQLGLVATESRLKPVSDFFLIERPGVTGFRPLLLSPGDCTRWQREKLPPMLSAATRRPARLSGHPALATVLLGGATSVLLDFPLEQ